MARRDPSDEIRSYEEAKTARAPYEPDWRQAAAYVLPRQYSSWVADGPAVMNAGQRVAKRFSYDNTGVNALPKYVSILNRLITPDGQKYVTVTANDASLMKVYRVRMFFDELTEKLDKMRRQARARCVQAQGEMYGSIGVYGVGPVRISWRDRSAVDRAGGLMHKALPVRDFFVITDEDGNIDGAYYRFWLNARQFRAKFGDTPAPQRVAAELTKNGGPSETKYFEFVHVVRSRPLNDYDPEALNARRHPFVASYISVEDKEYVGEEEGFISLPYIMPRVASEPGELYGYSPAMQALPALGGVNAMKRTIIKQAHKAVDPVLLANDDGVLSGRVGLTPGFINYGGIDSQGRRMLDVLPTGNLNVAEGTLADERRDINDAFFVTLFELLAEKEMTATQVMERIAEKGSILAPAMGRMQSEFLAPRTMREIDLLAEHGMLPELPPELIEAKGEYELEYTSPLAKAIYADEVAGFFRLQQVLMELAAAKQDPAILDFLNYDAALPEIGAYMSVKTRWINDAATVNTKREENAAAQQQSEILKQAPAIASVARASMDKAL